MSIEIRVVSVDEYPSVVPRLAELLIETVSEGVSLGFLPPVDRAEAEWYWTSLRPDLVTGSRLLVGAFHDGRIVGSGQLSLPSWPNAKHRAELQKLFVAASRRGLRVGQSLVAGLHDAARRRGRSLVLLHARRPVADGFYKPLGYREVGVIPGYSTGVSGERIDTVALYAELAIAGTRGQGDKGTRGQGLNAASLLALREKKPPRPIP